MIRWPLVFVLLFVIVALVLFPIPENSPRLRSSKILRIGYVSGPQELLHSAALRFADEVEKATEQRIKVKIYPSGQLGSELVQIEGLKLNCIDMTITGTALIGWIIPQYGVVDAPFLWRDYDHLEAVWNGPVGAELRQAMKAKSGIEIREIWPRGQRYLTSTSKRITHPRDLSGFKLRVPDFDVYIKSWTVFGANTTPLPFTDMFMGLKLGVVDGQENPLAVIYSNNLHEVQHYIMETEHLIGFYLFCTGPHVGERFSRDELKVFDQALDEATRWHNAEVAHSEMSYRKKLEEYGVEFVPVDREAFQRLATDKIPPLFEKTWAPGVYQRILETR